LPVIVLFFMFQRYFIQGMADERDERVSASAPTYRCAKLASAESIGIV
jgi:hypothetical protein